MPEKYMKKISLVILLLLLLAIGISLGGIYIISQKNRTYQGTFVKEEDLSWNKVNTAKKNIRQW